MHSILPLFALAFAAAAPAVATEVVSLPQFRSVELRGGGDIVVRPGPVQRVTILEGSSQFTQFHVEPYRKLRIDACNNRCPRHYRLRIQIESPQVPDVAIAGGGAIRATGGFAPQSQLSAAVHGGGEIDLRAVQAASVSAAINGGGQISVAARNSLSAAVNGGGEIRYAGNPQVSMAVHGGGVVHAMN